MNKLYFTIFALIFSLNIEAIKPKTEAEIKQAELQEAGKSFGGMPADIKKYIIQFLITKNLRDSIKNIRNYAITNKSFFNLLNDSNNLKWLYARLKSDFPHESFTAELASIFPNIKSPEMQVWIKKYNEDLGILYTELEHAIINLNIEKIKELINKNPKMPNFIFAWKMSALLFLIDKFFTLHAGPESEEKFLKIAELFLKTGIDVNAQDSGGNTAILSAVRNQFIPLLRLLAQYNPDVQIANKDGSTVDALIQKMADSPQKEEIEKIIKEIEHRNQKRK